MTGRPAVRLLVAKVIARAVARAMVVSGAALALGGCLPATRGVAYQISGSGKLSRADAYAVLYGIPSSAGPRHIPRDNALARRPAAETAEIYSADWQRLEAERESRLKQSSAICRC